MNSPFQNGSIRQQDVEARNIARQRIAEAVNQEARRCAVLVTNKVGIILNSQGPKRSAEDIWNDVLNDESLRAIQSRADDNVADYPCFASWLNGARNQIRFAEMKRIYGSLGDRDFHGQFKTILNFRPAYA